MSEKRNSTTPKTFKTKKLNARKDTCGLRFRLCGSHRMQSEFLSCTLLPSIPSMFPCNCNRHLVHEQKTFCPAPSAYFHSCFALFLRYKRELTSSDEKQLAQSVPFALDRLRRRKILLVSFSPLRRIFWRGAIS